MTIKKYRRMLAMILSVSLLSGGIVGQAEDATERVTEKVTEAVSEPIPVETAAQSENVTEEAVNDQAAETVKEQEKSEPVTERITETESAEYSAPESAAEEEKEVETSESAAEEEKEVETSESAAKEEVESETSESAAGEEEGSEASESVMGDIGESAASESEETEAPSYESEMLEETMPETSEEKKHTELKLKITDGEGKELAVQKITGTKKLTCDGVTLPVDYGNGVYRVNTVVGTENLQVTILEPEHVTDARLTKWNGYLAEQEKNWILYPDEQSAHSFVSDGTVYTVNLEKYMLEQSELTMEQLAVYGPLDWDMDYAEVFLYSPDVSAVILVEFVNAETEISTENTESENDSDEKEEPETEAATDIESAESESASEVMQTEEMVSEGMELLQEIQMEEELQGSIELYATPEEKKNAYENAGKNLASSAESYTPTVSSINGEWQILGLVRSEQEVSDSVYEKYVENVIHTLQEKDGVLHKKKYTEYSRVVLALTALGEDVTDVGGYNLLEPLADFDKTVWQGVNGAIFALIAFDSHDYEIPVTKGTTQTTREKLINHILSLEISGGGWALSGSKADPDMTGMAIQALAPYYGSSPAVKNAVDRAVNRLSSMQLADGGFGSYGDVNSESCSQVIVALTALGINPDQDTRFIKNGNSVVDALITYSTGDGGFKHLENGSADQMSTEQAYYALTSYYRFLNGQNSLYDMNDIPNAADYKKAEAAEKILNALPTVITLEDTDAVQNAYNVYNRLTKLQKTLISQDAYRKLQDARKTLGELDVELESETESESEIEPITENTQQESGDKTNTENKQEQTNRPSSVKKPSGTTKKVNLVSSPKRTGGTTISLSETSDNFDEAESETETESDTEKIVSRTGRTQIPEAAGAVITELRSLFGKSKTEAGNNLPEDPADYTDVQIDSILEIYRSYERLTSEEQTIVENNSGYADYLEVLEKMKTVHHYDEATGTDVRDNEEEILPWYVRLEVASQFPDEQQAEKVRTALKQSGDVFQFSDIHLINLKDGGLWQGDDLIRVSVPMVDIGTYENAAIVHIRDDGTMEFLEAHISGENLEFDTDEFSVFGIVGYNGSLETLMEEEESVMWIYALPGGGALVLLFLLFLLRKKIIRSEGR